MPLSISSKFTKRVSKMLCYYFNDTHEIQLIRVRNGIGYGSSKMIFPQQRILFEAVPEEILEVHVQQEGKQVLKATFSCLNLQVNKSQPGLVTSQALKDKALHPNKGSHARA